MIGQEIFQSNTENKEEIMHSFEHTARENMCDECDQSYEWATAIELTGAKVKAEEMIAEKCIKSDLPRLSKAEWTGYLMGLYKARNLYEEILND